MSGLTKIELAQIELPDLAAIKEHCNSLNQSFLADSYPTGIQSLLDRHEQLETNPGYYFSVKSTKPGEFKKGLLGFVALVDPDWISRVAELRLLVKTPTKEFLTPIVRFAFKELNLNKIWLEVVAPGPLLDLLPAFGFVLEGVRRKALYRAGKLQDVSVFSLLAQELIE